MRKYKRMKEKNVLGLLFFLSLTGCSDSKNGPMITNDDLIGKNWCYNGWHYNSNKYGYLSGDVVEMIRFEQGGKMIGTEFSGRKDTLFAYWNLLDEYVLDLRMPDDKQEQWGIVDYNKGKLVLNNGWGDRTYEQAPTYLEGVYGDAFWVNEYIGESEIMQTSVGFKVQKGNVSISEAYALLSESESGRIKLTKKNNAWEGQAAESLLGTGKQFRVRFYCRLGKDQFKFDEQVYAENMPVRNRSDFELKAVWNDSSLAPRLDVSWNMYESGDIHYGVEVFDKNMNLDSPFFVSYTLAAKDRLEISASTGAKVNRMGELKKGESYRVRLSAFVYEPGVNPNDNNAEYNIQAVTYVTRSFTWGE